MDVKEIECVFYWPTEVVGGGGEGLSSLNIQYKDYSFADILLAAVSAALLEATRYLKYLSIYFLYNFMCRMFGSTCIILYIICFVSAFKFCL